MSLTASTEGVDRLVDTLADAAGQVNNLDPGPTGVLLVNAALPRTPRDKGLLATTVRAVVVDQTVILTAGGGPVDYAVHVHADQPWLADTIHDQADQIVTTTLDQLVDVLNTIQGA